jgi:putative copper export protein
VILALSGLARGLALVALAAALGGLVLDRLVLPSGAPALAPARRRLSRLIIASFIALALATLVELVTRTQAMSNAALGAALAMLPDVVRRTHVGTVLAARAAGALVALALSCATGAAPRLLALISALGFPLTLSLSGHAADWGDLTSSVAIDWVHAAAASAWTGGLLALAVSVLPDSAAAPRELLGGVARRFSRLAGGCLAAVVVTGVLNAWWQLGAISRLWTTAYGRVLLAKVALALVLSWIGAMNRYLVVPRLISGRRHGVGARLFRAVNVALLGRGARVRAGAARFSTYVGREALVALALFACTAALSELTPGRHTAFERKPAGHVTNITPLGPGAGQRTSGTVSPPPGDIARGRSVFARLECFTCHAVPGERYPAPSRPGPSLAGVGRYPPGYLLESVVNPNARIVDGPEYTDDRGLSTMPDYRDKLTVGELIDLVGYLGSLRGESPPARAIERRGG